MNGDTLLVVISFAVFLVIPLIISIWLSLRITRKLITNSGLFKTFLFLAPLFITLFFLFQKLFILPFAFLPYGALLLLIAKSGIGTVFPIRGDVLYLALYLLGLVLIFTKLVVTSKQPTFASPVGISSYEEPKSGNNLFTSLLWMLLPLFAICILGLNFNGLFKELTVRSRLATSTLNDPSLCKTLKSSGTFVNTDTMIAECVVKSIPEGSSLTNYCDSLPNNQLPELSSRGLTKDTCYLKKQIETNNPLSCESLKGTTYPGILEKCWEHFTGTAEHVAYCSKLEGNPSWPNLMPTLLGSRCINENNVNMRDYMGRTMLFYARTEDEVNLLFANNADPNITDNNGDTALLRQTMTISAYQGTDQAEKVIELLLKNGSNPNIINKENYTPLKASVIQYSTEGIIKLLLQYHADPNMFGFGGIGGVCEIINTYSSPRTDQIKPYCHDTNKIINDKNNVIDKFYCDSLGSCTASQ